MYYLKTRYYNPTLCRFISADSQLNDHAHIMGANLFSYCYNNPVYYLDSDGRVAIEIGSALYSFGVGVGCVIVLVAGVYIIESAEFQQGWDDFCGNITEAMTVMTDAVDSVISRSTTRSESKAEEKEKDVAANPKNNAPTYYHSTSWEAAWIIMQTGVMIGGAQEGGYIFAWRRIPDSYALRNSGASFGVLISFQTYAAFEEDINLQHPKIRKYLPVRSVRRGTITVWNVSVVKPT